MRGHFKGNKWRIGKNRPDDHTTVQLVLDKIATNNNVHSMTFMSFEAKTIKLVLSK